MTGQEAISGWRGKGRVWLGRPLALGFVLALCGIQDAAAGEILFREDFESGILAACWATNSTGQGRLRITEEWGPAGGVRHVVMDDSQSDLLFSLNELVLTVDLAGQSNVVLSFMHKSLNDEDHEMPAAFSGSVNADGVAVSSDGGTTWHKVQGLTSSNFVASSYRLFEVPLVPGGSWSLCDGFQIKFQQYDDSPAEEDGFALDDISLASAAPMYVADVGVSVRPFLDSYIGTPSNYWPMIIRVSNAGPDTAYGVAVTNILPTNALLITAGSGYEYDAAAHAVIFRLAELPREATSEWGCVAMPRATGAAWFVSTVSITGDDPNRANNTGTFHQVLYTNGLPEISLECSVTIPLAVPASQVLTTDVRVVNHGGVPVSNVLVVSEWSAAPVFSNATRSVYVCGNLVYTRMADVLPPGGSQSCRYRYQVHADGPAVLTNLVHLRCDRPYSTTNAYVLTNLVHVLPPLAWEKVLDGFYEQRYLAGAYSGGAEGSMPAFADMDADGDLDLILGSKGRLSYYENVGHSRAPAWVPPVALAAQNYSWYAPTLADLDGDGDLDMLSGCGGGTLDYYRNDGTAEQPVWAAPQYDYAGLDVGGRSRPCLGDINGDGLPDLLVGNTAGEIVCLTNIGTGASAAWSPPATNFPMPAYGFSYAAPRLVDINVDGKPDVYAGYQPWPEPERVLLLCWTNYGTAEQPAWPLCSTQYFELAVSSWYDSFAPSFADIDGDGDEDLFVGRANGPLGQVEDIRSTFEAPWRVVTPMAIFLDLKSGYIAGCDLDGDGDQDLLAAEGSDAVGFTLYENAGTPVAPMWRLAETNYTRWPCTGESAAAFCDIDDDGDHDLFVNYFYGSSPDTEHRLVALVENTGTVRQAAWAEPVTNYLVLPWTNGVPVVAAPAFCDLDGDGDQDLFMGSGFWNEPVQQVENTGTASVAAWAPAAAFVFNDPSEYYPGGIPFFADTDEDGDFDLLVLGAGSRWGLSGYQLYYYANLGDRHHPRWSQPIALFTEVAHSALAADLDGDGDPDLLLGDQETGLWFYRNHASKLHVIPGQRTLESGSGCAFSVTNAGTPAWQFVAPVSGGSLDPVSGVYQAGPTQGLDIVEARLPGGAYGRAFVNVVASNSAAGFQKAILVAGRNTDDAYDPVWRATDYLGAQAYNTLRQLRYPKASIHYLNPQPDQDVDDNGLYDDIAGPTTGAGVNEAFTNWAGGASNLFVYLVDHGATNEGGGYMRLNPSEVLWATNLAARLNALQNTYAMEVTVVLDFCYAGRFVPALAYTGAAKRVVIAAAGGDEPTFFVAGGLVSFSEAFFNSLRLGVSAGHAYALARDAMSDYQGSWLDDDGDGLFQRDVDGAAAGGLYVGGGAGGSDIPQIVGIASNQVLAGSQAAWLWAQDVSAAQPIDRVWCVIVPPGYNPDPEHPVADLPEVELRYNADGRRYEACFQGFNQAGTYKAIYYAHAQGGGMSFPKYGYVVQAGADERAILVAGGTTNLALWTNLNGVANNAWETLLTRQFTTDTVHYLSMDTNQPGVDETVSLAGVGMAITNWAAGSSKLTICLAGEGTNGELRLTESDTLAAAQLDAWLDAYQESNRTVIAVLDFAGAGVFITNMTTPPGRVRILVAGSGTNEPAIFEQEGWLSFSRLFWSHIFSGANVLDAFVPARDVLFNLTRGAQDPQLDDNGNGAPNEKDEGALAEGQYIGSAFVTGAEAPVIGAVTLDTILAGTNALTLWASEIVAAAGVDRLWCVVTPPSDAEDPAQVTVDLPWEAGPARYEAVYTNFTEPGVYFCTFFAMDVDGIIGAPRQAQVFSADRYEPDDSPDEAPPFEIAGVQIHNIHAAGDEDWVEFFVVTDFVYEVRARHLGTNVDTVLDLYRVSDGVLTNVYHRDAQGAGAGQGEYALLEHWAAGTYLARVRSYSPSQAGIGTEYELRIYVPDAPSQTFLCILGASLYDADHSPPGAKAYIGTSEYSFSGGANLIQLSPFAEGTYTIRVEAPGCLPAQHASRAGQVEDQNNQAYGNPRRVRVRSGAFVVAPFLLEPLARVDGVARDDWTAKRLKEARIRFVPTSASGLPCSQYDGYPGYASYRQRWTTALDGSFPTNVLVPPRAGTLIIAADGYSNGVRLLPALSAGSYSNAGSLACTPIPTNGGSLPARWINLYFGGPTNIAANVDTDGDGADNWTELLTDMNPNDPDSVFGVLKDGVALLPSGWVMQWPGMAGHAYQVAGCSNLLPESWAVLAGPWTNWDARVMGWTNAAPGLQRYYRVEEFRP